ncbi:hypothetical protein AVEN_87204-1 [Araneus ventricosus]|uniref:Uncharacterized protein n=1 Tax=Araneus ventricosus TaxID=182803 RepID=A0A4Y2VQZ1_ARAVE|nr:hypothetical protein AVEN_87204-1 [Araneus ventricosus]
MRDHLSRQKGTYLHGHYITFRVVSLHRNAALPEFLPLGLPGMRPGNPLLQAYQALSAIGSLCHFLAVFQLFFSTLEACVTLKIHCTTHGNIAVNLLHPVKQLCCRFTELHTKFHIYSVHVGTAKMITRIVAKARAAELPVHKIQCLLAH